MGCFTLKPSVTEIWMCLKCWLLHSQQRGYMFGYEQDQSFCWRYHYQFVMSAKSRLNSSARKYYPQVIACSTVSLTALFKNALCAVWLQTNVLTVELRFLGKRKRNSTLLTTRHICLHMQILRSSRVCYLKFHIERKRLSFLPHSNRRTAKAPTIR